MLLQDLLENDKRRSRCYYEAQYESPPNSCRWRLIKKKNAASDVTAPRGNTGAAVGLGTGGEKRAQGLGFSENVGLWEPESTSVKCAWGPS